MKLDHLRCQRFRIPPRESEKTLNFDLRGSHALFRCNDLPVALVHQTIIIQNKQNKQQVRQASLSHKITFSAMDPFSAILLLILLLIFLPVLWPLIPILIILAIIF